MKGKRKMPQPASTDRQKAIAKQIRKSASNQGGGSIGGAV